MDTEPPLPVRRTQDDRLGDWHPARRPNGHETLDRYNGHDNGSGPPSESAENYLMSPNPLDSMPEPSSAEQQPGADQSPLESKGSRAQSPTDGQPRAEECTDADRYTHTVRNEDEYSILQQQQSLGGRQDDEVYSTAQRERNFAQDPEAASTRSRSGANDESSEPEPRPSNAAPPCLSCDTKSSVEPTLVAAPGNDDFTMLRSYNRTNSFPDVLPVQSSRRPPHPLPHSQAEDILEENEEEIGPDAFPSNDPSDDASQDPFGDVQGYEEDDFYTQTAAVHSGTMPTPPDEEARYEEGLPLVPSGFQERELLQNLREKSETGASLLAVAGTSEDDFFDKITSSATQENSSFRPQPLDRKTTSQVLDSMHYAPHNETHDASDSAKDRPALPNWTGGGPAVSSSADISQVLGDQQSNMINPEAKDEDLAAMWQAALDDDELLEEAPSADPSSLFEDDGEGFLEGETDEAEAQSAMSPSLQSVYSPDGRMEGFTSGTTATNHDGPSTQNRHMPNNNASSQIRHSPASAPQQSSAGLSQTSPPLSNGLSSSTSAPTGFQGLSRQQPGYGNFSASSRPQMPSSAQSFADKSKGGYTSPYDLPMDVTRPKKRNYIQQLRPGTSSSAAVNRPPPPPRSSSMFTSDSPIEAQPPLSSIPSAIKSLPVAHAPASIQKPKSSAGGFFEELPSVKPRPSNHFMRPSPPAQQMAGPLPIPPQPQSYSQARPELAKPSGPLSREQTYGLVPPGRASLYENVPQQVPSGPVVPTVSSRYSPAPASQTHVPPPRTRYAKSPSRASIPQTRPFQPRTSSPLAQSGATAQQYQQAAVADGTAAAKDVQRPHFGEASEHYGYTAAIESSTLPERSQLIQPSPTLLAGRDAPLSSSSTPSYAINTPESDQLPLTTLSSGGQSQGQQLPEPTHVELAPPRRSQTQSPGAVRSRPPLPTISKDVYQRPASVNDWAVHQQTIPPNVASVYQPSGRPRGFSQSLEYIRPSDGRENDDLERWKGCPIFSFGFGGTTVTTFPKQVPRYAAGCNKPLMKCSPGEVKVQSAKALTLDDNITTFPGPLKSKNKKKEVLDWLQQRIVQLETAYIEIAPSPVLPDPRKRQEEKTLLWRVLQVLVESDGLIEGKAAAEKAVRLILSPAMAEGATDNFPPSSITRLLGISRSTGYSNISDPTASQDLEALRKILLQGERERAVWHALDRRMWAHAMLISSTLDKSIWKQVLQEFIRQEVRSFGENTESLAALYQIFAGNWEESIDELVPPSARAGLQFVSKAEGTGPTRNALDGLDRWRETLTLALSNRSQNDTKALVALGRLLSGYGRTEAAHICFIFARSPDLFGGADDPSVSFALLGADHLQHPYDFSRDSDSILLTEIYEFACNVLGSSASVTVPPHLQAYKLYHAMMLAEYGDRSQAQQYCDSITSALKSTTKRSPYYHDMLFGTLDDLVSRLRQAPTDSSSSWMSKPSLDKVSGSFFSKVNQFIAGDDSDADSAVSGKGVNPTAGPFAGVSGDMPSMSRSSSLTDLYESHPSVPPLPGGAASGSRYTPSGQFASQGQYTPRSSLEHNGRSPQEHRRPSQRDSLKPTSLFPQSSPNLSRASSSSNLYQQPPQLQAKSAQYPPHNESYLPTPPSQPEYIPEAPPDELPTSLYEQELYRPTPPPEPQPSQSPYGLYQAAAASQPDHTSSSPRHELPPSIYEPPTPSYLPPASSYEPPTPGMDSPTAGYKPPSISAYQDSSYGLDTQYNKADDETLVPEKPKTKSFMDDDDDDFTARAAAILKQEKAQKDREADDAFRRAAEADCESAFSYTYPCVSLIIS